MIEEVKAPTASLPNEEKHEKVDNKQKPAQRSNHAKTHTCTFCFEAHGLFRCDKFLALGEIERLNFVREKNLCMNCLFPGHETIKCNSKYDCKKCHQRHHIPIHEAVISAESSAHIAFSETEPSFSGIVTVNKCIILATAKIPVFTMDGRRVILKALLDQGSQVNIISEGACQLLGLKKKKSGVPLFGIGNTPAGVVKHSAAIIMGQKSMTLIDTTSMRWLCKKLQRLSQSI